MTNQQFCYWLQGFFEIALDNRLHAEQIKLIEFNLNKINEPLGFFTQWLNELCIYFSNLDYKQETIDYFTLHIQNNLNSIFLHVIDQNYATHYSADELKKIHDGHSHD
jgi:hypothetical protein